MQVEFECIVCGTAAVATVADEAGSDDEAEADEPLKTTRDCPDCGIETIWIES